MENFNTLSAVVSGGNVVLTWNLNPVTQVTAVNVQRSPYGSSAWATIASPAPATGVMTLTDTPAAGTYEYRIQVLSTQGSIDALQTPYFSNEVNVSTLASTGVIVASVTTNADKNNNGTQVNLSWTTPSVGDVLEYVIERSLNSGTTFKQVAENDEFEDNLWSEVLPIGLGVIQYRIRAFLPPEQVGNPVNFPQTLSNVVSVTL